MQHNVEQLSKSSAQHKKEADKYLAELRRKVTFQQTSLALLCKACVWLPEAEKAFFLGSGGHHGKTADRAHESTKGSEGKQSGGDESHKIPSLIQA